MLDDLPDVKQANVQYVGRPTSVLDSFRREASKCGIDERCKQRLQRAMDGIYQRGFEASLPEKSLPVFTAKYGDETLDTRILRHGTVTESVGIEDYANMYDFWLDKGDMPSVNNPKKITGQAWDPAEGKQEDIHNCVVTTNLDNGSPLHRYTQPDQPVIFPRLMTNQFELAHESEHCLYQPAYAPDETTDRNYLLSVKETSADLSAALNYARVTGDFDIYPLLIRPFRMSAVEDNEHATAYALDEMLRQVDPSLIKGIDAKEIPKLVEAMMVENFEDGRGHVIPLDSEHASGPMKRMALEMRSRENIMAHKDHPILSPLSQEGMSYAKNTLASLQRNHQAFLHLAPSDKQHIPGMAYDNFVTMYHLQNVDKDIIPNLSAQPEVKDSKLDRGLDIMMGL